MIFSVLCLVFTKLLLLPKVLASPGINHQFIPPPTSPAYTIDLVKLKMYIWLIGQNSQDKRFRRSGSFTCAGFVYKRCNICFFFLNLFLLTKWAGITNNFVFKNPNSLNRIILIKLESDWQATLDQTHQLWIFCL